MALLLPLARTILKYALFYHGTGHLQKILNIAGLSDVGDTFSFYGEASGVETGSKYRLTVKADVHRNGTVESLNESSERTY